jgi:hypothetical protein
MNNELYQRLHDRAEANGRSLSEEAEALLYGAFDEQARAHEAFVGMVARGEAQLVVPTPTIPGTFLVAPTGTPPLYLAEVAGAAGSKPSGTDESVESFRRIAKFLAAAFRDKEVVAAAREMLKTAVGEVREEVAAGPDPGSGTRSRRKVTGRADST